VSGRPGRRARVGAARERRPRPVGGGAALVAAAAGRTAYLDGRAAKRRTLGTRWPAVRAAEAALAARVAAARADGAGDGDGDGEDGDSIASEVYAPSTGGLRDAKELPPEGCSRRG